MSNEITVKIKCSVNKLINQLEKENFKIIEKFHLQDKYFIPKGMNIKEHTSRELLRNAILLRYFDEELPKRKQYKLTFKRKQIDRNGNISKQDKAECEILNIEDGIKFLNSIGYIEIMEINEFDLVFEKQGLEITIKNIENGDQLLEIETVKNNTELDTIEKIIQKIEELNIPIDKSNYFVKKAEIELEKIL